VLCILALAVHPPARPWLCLWLLVMVSRMAVVAVVKAVQVTKFTLDQKVAKHIFGPH